MRYVYVNVKGTSAKVWGCDLFKSGETGESYVTWYWGSIGKYMHELTKKKAQFPNYAEAYDAVMDKIQEKERKGYMRCPNAGYFQLITDFRCDLEELVKEANDAEKV